MKLPVGILASGTGTNFEAIAEAAADGRLTADVRVLICNRFKAPVLKKAERLRVPAMVIDHQAYGTRESFDTAVADALEQHGVDLVVMAGFDRIVTTALLSRFPNRVINIHPALLPAFRGTDAQAQAARYGVTIAGATVHVVDEQVDHGPIIVQAAVPIVAGEDTETVRMRILAQEHRIYPWAIQLFAEGRVRVCGRLALIDGVAPADDEALVSPPLPPRLR